MLVWVFAVASVHALTYHSVRNDSHLRRSQLAAKLTHGDICRCACVHAIFDIRAIKRQPACHTSQRYGQSFERCPRAAEMMIGAPPLLECSQLLNCYGSGRVQYCARLAAHSYCSGACQTQHWRLAGVPSARAQRLRWQGRCMWNKRDSVRLRC
jgi:hypothetical protein